MDPQESQELKRLILNSSEPLVFKNKLNWEIVKWSLNDWGSLLQDQELSFRCGKNSFTKEPQWERTTSSTKTSFQNFLLSTQSESQEWMYFDYKYLKEWFNNLDELKKNIDWSFFGFPEIKSDDCTIWIGSKGAHTPCHIDTYGCNLIGQIHGRKQWLLFPPEEGLKSTRIPYEESSIYSKLNFFSPTIEDFKGIGNCRKVILEPGDVLFVPHKWWHYVENLETAISINVWLPLPEDDEERLKESLIQLCVSQIVNNVNRNIKNVVLNPNSDEVVEEMSLNASLSLVKKCKDICMSSNKRIRSTPNIKTDRFSVPLSQVIGKYQFVSKVPKLNGADFDIFLKFQSQRFRKCEESSKKKDEEVDELVDLINAFTHPEVITLIKNKLLE